MDNVDEILEEPIRHEDKSIATRLTYTEERDRYRVEYTNILQNGELDGNWGVFGGSVGYNASEYDTEEEARSFYDEIENLSNEEIMAEMAIGENP